MKSLSSIDLSSSQSTGIASLAQKMVDQSNARRRHHPSSKAAPKTESRTSRTEIRSGEPSDTEDDIGHNQNLQSSQHPRSHTGSHRNGSKRRTKKRRRRKRRDENDPPFVILFIQVGAVLFSLCFASLHVYRYVFPSVETYAEDDQYYYVGDESGDALTGQSIDNENDPNAGYDPEYRQKQELKLNELLRTVEDEDVTKSSDKLQTGDNRQSRKVKTEESQNKTMPPLPEFTLSKYSNWDAFGIFETMKEIDNNSEDIREAMGNPSAFWREARNMRMQFAELYGGENAARMLIDRGTTRFPSIPISNNYNNSNTGASDTAGSSDSQEIPPGPPSDVVATACRLHQAKSENRPFRMAFGGYSVTAGRGNKHQDSYPFQLKGLLEPMLKAAGFSEASPLSVTNAAIGGVPSFPYGWCMLEFWGGGKDTEEGNDSGIAGIPDVVSWDFGMNEASGGPEGLEAYIRHLLSTYVTQTGTSNPPKLIVKDHFTARYRKQVLAEYSAILKDPVLLHTEHAVEPIFDFTQESAKGYDEKEDWRRPLGFRKWREWGAPKGAPGQAVHHPAVQEHKLNGWILAMHFVTALEYMVVMEGANVATSSHWCPLPTLQKDNNKKSQSTEHSTTSSPFSLPPPVSRIITNNTDLPYDGIFFGYPETIESDGYNKNSSVSTLLQEASSSSRPWRMNPIRCRTTFEPKFSGDLSGLVVSGTMGEDLDPTLPKSQYYYNEGWTYDLSEAEKSAKRKLNLYPESLGFRDSKEAYYGIYESPPMTLLLPYDNKAEGVGVVSKSLPKVDDPAAVWYESIVVCQVNDKNTFDSAFADPNSCSFASDVALRIGGVDVNQNATRMLNTIGSVYLGKPICKHVAIPPLARLTSHNTLLSREEAGKDSDSSRGVMAGDGRNSVDSRFLEVDQIGLLVEIFVSNPHIVHINQACSLSHVVWEQSATRHPPYNPRDIKHR